MILFCWLFGHVFDETRHNVTELSWVDGKYDLRFHTTQTVLWACCRRCGRMNPEFLAAQKINAPLAKRAEEE